MQALQVGAGYVDITARTDKLRSDLEAAKRVTERSTDGMAKSFSKIDAATVRTARAANDMGRKIDDAADRAGRSLERSLESRLTRMQGLMSSFAKGAIAGVSVGVVTDALFSLSKAAVETAANTNEMENKVDVAFGAMATSVRSWSDEAEGRLGRANITLREYASNLGVVVAGLGVTGDKAQKMSTDLAELSVDLGSMFNVKDADAMQAIISGITGETEPLKRFGVVLNQNALDAQLMADGIKGGSKEATEAEKAIARYEIILKNTSLAHGDAERTAGSLVNQQKALQEETKKLMNDWGQELIPLTLELTQDTRAMIPVIKELGTEFINMSLGAVSAIRDIVNASNDLANALNFIPKDIKIKITQEVTSGWLAPGPLKAFTQTGKWLSDKGKEEAQKQAAKQMGSSIQGLLAGGAPQGRVAEFEKTTAPPTIKTGGGSKSGGSGSKRADNTAERKAQLGEDINARLEDELRNLIITNEQDTVARQKLEQADLKKDQARARQEILDKKLLKADEDKALAKLSQVQTEQQRALDEKQRKEIEKQNWDTEQELLNARIDWLSSLVEDDLSRDERIEFQQKMLDAQKELNLAILDHALAEKQITQDIYDLRKQTLENNYQKNSQNIKDDNASPLSKWLKEQMKATSPEGIKDSIEQTYVNGLETMIDDLSAVATGAKSAKEAFRDFAFSVIADLIKIQIRKSIVSAIDGLSNGSSGSSGGGIIQGGIKLLSSIFGGARAGGGGVSTGKSYWVGENSPELFTPETNGAIWNPEQLGQLASMRANQNVSATAFLVLDGKIIDQRAFQISAGVTGAGMSAQAQAQRSKSLYSTRGR